MRGGALPTSAEASGTAESGSPTACRRGQSLPRTPRLSMAGRYPGPLKLSRMAAWPTQPGMWRQPLDFAANGAICRSFKRPAAVIPAPLLVLWSALPRRTPGGRVVQRDLIFDLGMYEGQDTRFYLSKGFRVIALEANPELCRRNAGTFAGEIAARRLTIVPKALWQEAGQTIPFYIYSAWSSVYPEIAGRDASPTTEVQVATTTIAEMFREFGVPYYLKCDIEGADKIVSEQLAMAPEKPDFVSMEDEYGELPKILATAGYDRFQFINQ